MKRHKTREKVISLLKGGTYPVYVGIEESIIRNALCNADQVSLLTVPCNSISAGCRRIMEMIPSELDEILVSVKFRNISFSLSTLAPLIEILADYNENANTTWGISIDENISCEIEINVLFIIKQILE
ncbi:MAG: hypothetical protein K2N34_09465 [Lachnospiraceae bacterium]|nr:hypothetical protein [Lachnospiraceae bacterium]